MGIQDPTLHLYVSLPQTRMRHVRLGQPVEVTLLLFPGRILAGRVRSFGAMTPQGQLQPSGVVSAAVLPTDRPLPFAVGIELDEKVDLDEELWTDLPGGSMGEATVYTESVEATHIIRRVMIRMEAWLNYLRPM